MASDSRIRIIELVSERRELRRGAQPRLERREEARDVALFSFAGQLA